MENLQAKTKVDNRLKSIGQIYCNISFVQATNCRCRFPRQIVMYTYAHARMIWQVSISYVNGQFKTFCYYIKHKNLHSIAVYPITMTDIIWISNSVHITTSYASIFLHPTLPQYL